MLDTTQEEERGFKAQNEAQTGAAHVLSCHSLV